MAALMVPLISPPPTKFPVSFGLGSPPVQGPQPVPVAWPEHDSLLERRSSTSTRDRETAVDWDIVTEQEHYIHTLGEHSVRAG